MWLEVFFLAFVLLVTPPDQDLHPPYEMFNAVQLPLKILCVHLEILDPKADAYMFVRQYDFFTDMNIVRRHYTSLKDAPPVAASWLFPRGATDARMFNSACKARLEVYQKAHPEKFWECAWLLDELAIRWKVWDLVSDAQNKDLYVTTRREALKQLRNRIGPEAFYSGQPPLWAPPEYFQPLVLP